MSTAAAAKTNTLGTIAVNGKPNTAIESGLEGTLSPHQRQRHWRGGSNGNRIRGTSGSGPLAIVFETATLTTTTTITLTTASSTGHASIAWALTWSTTTTTTTTTTMTTVIKQVSTLHSNRPSHTSGNITSVASQSSAISSTLSSAYSPRPSSESLRRLESPLPTMATIAPAPPSTGEDEQEIISRPIAVGIPCAIIATALFIVALLLAWKYRAKLKRRWRNTYCPAPVRTAA